jgi:hypothetical protein
LRFSCVTRKFLKFWPFSMDFDVWIMAPINL